MSDDEPRDPPRNAASLLDQQERSLSASERCHLLASDRRRTLLEYLVARPEEPVPVDDLVAHLVTAEDAIDRQNLRLSLQHLHLPKLINRGVVVRDESRQRVRYVPHPELERLLAFVEDEA